MLNLKIISTNDGSKTLKISEWNEHYHSTHGAISEAQHVYIKNGLDLIKSQEISIFEMGFGTGLNTFLSYLYGLEQHRIINYYAIENEPLSLELVNQLEYVDLLDAFSEEHIFNKMHTCSWDMLLFLISLILNCSLELPFHSFKSKTKHTSKGCLSLIVEK